MKLGEVCEDRISRLNSLDISEIDYIDISSVDNKRKVINHTARYRKEVAPGRAQQVVKIGDVLVSTVRPNLNAVAIVNIRSEATLIASTGFSVLRATDVVVPEYLYYFVQTDLFIEPLVEVSEKASYPSVTDSIVKDVEIPLPPLAVQREIVARLEKNLAMVERMAKGFAALKTEADQLFKSTLKETFEEVSCGGTETRRLGDVCEIQRGGSPRPIKNFITDDQNGLNWIKIGDVSPDGKYITKTADKIKQSGLSKTRQVFEGDFLLSNSMSFGRPYILRISGCIHDGWLVLRGFKKVFLEEYFYYLLRSDFVQDQFNKLAHGSTVRNLNTDAVAMVEVCEIPFSTQRRIVAKLDAVRERCEKLKRAAEEGLQTAALMRKAILKEAFA